jgi:hypothetical protein
MRTLAIILTPAILAGAGIAQNFNIDVTGGTGSTPLPSTSFGAAAGQPGVWTPLDCSLGPVSTLLVDVTGAATSVTMTRTAGSGLAGAGGVVAGMTADDLAFICDFELARAPRTWTLAGLAAGTYSVYTYAWMVNLHTGISINGGPVTSVGGAWSGAYAPGLTHAVDTVTVASGGSISVQITYLSGFPPNAFFNGLQITRNTSTSSFCDGSAVGITCLACGNNGAADNGCANSGYSAGGHLASSGVAGASSGTDTLVLTSSNIPGPGLFFQANGLAVAPISFGDGELCATAGILRLGVVFPAAASASYPGGLTPNPIHIAGSTVAGDVRHYQCWYRDAAAFCTSATSNVTQGLTITWEP